MWCTSIHTTLPKMKERIKPIKWTEQDVDFLKKNYSEHGGQYCAIHLNRPYETVSRKAFVLNLKINKTKTTFLKENFEPIVKTSNSYMTIIKNLGMRVTGNSYRTVKKYIREYEIDVSHFFHDVSHLLSSSKSRLTPLEEILIENSTYDRSNLKKRLYQTGLKKRECELCKQGEEWNGKHMSLILDHINGVNTDARIENLRIVCPNCNATLDTHCGKHLKKINNCVDCKTKIYNYAKRCQPCSVKYEKEKGELLKVQTRPPYSLIVSSIEELGYEKAGKKFGVCGMTIRRWKKEEGERLSAANKNRRERRRKLSSDRSIQGKS